MIKILKENDLVENITDEQILQIYAKQKSRINDLVQLKIDKILEKLPKYKDAIVDELIRDVISSYYFDNNELTIVAATDDFEDRMEEIKDIIKLQEFSDEQISSDIDDILLKIIDN